MRYDTADRESEYVEDRRGRGGGTFFPRGGGGVIVPMGRGGRGLGLGWLLLIGIGCLLLGNLVTSCGSWGSETKTYIILVTTGHLTTSALATVSEGSFSIGDEIAYFPPVSGSGPTIGTATATFTVEQAGLTTFTLQQVEQEQGGRAIHRCMAAQTGLLCPVGSRRSADQRAVLERS